MQNQGSTAKNIQDKATDQTENAIKSVKNTAENLRSNVQDFAGKAGDVADNASQKISQAADMVATEIRSKPVQYALLGLGIGILGTLFYRRGD